MRLSILRAVGCMFIGVAVPAMAEDAGLLEKVRSRMVDNLAHLPNYSCLETAERSERPGTSNKFKLIDVLHLEVGWIAGKDIFFWPGEARLEDRVMRRLPPLGAVATSTATMHIRDLFHDKNPEFNGPVDETVDGRRLLRWGYSIPVGQGAWPIAGETKQAMVGSKGSFWVDPETFDVVRLTAEAVGIPRDFGIELAAHSVTFQRADFGKATPLIPQATEMTLRDAHLLETVNKVSYSNCHPYVPTPKNEAAPVLRSVELPPDAVLYVVLDNDVTFGTNGVGDPIALHLERPVKVGGTEVFPKGATINGKIVLLRHQKFGFREQGMSDYAVGFELVDLRSDQAQAKLHAVLEEDPGTRKSQQWTGPTGMTWDLAIPGLPTEDSGKIFLAWTGPLVAKRGLHMVWRTVRVGAAPQGKR